MEGLSAKVIRESAERSRSGSGMDRLDLMYAHIDDLRVPLEETVEAFGELVAAGAVGLLGVSNHWAWRVERAGTGGGGGAAGYEVLQYHHTYLRQRPTCRGGGRRTASRAWRAGTCSATCGPTPGSPWWRTRRC